MTVTRDFREAHKRDVYRVMSSLVVPRPIAWITTLGADGTVNLAPFSSVMGIFNPPAFAVTFGRRKDGSLKDTHRNMRERGEAVIHMADEKLLETLHASAAEVPPEVSEAGRLGLDTVPSDAVDPPRLPVAPAAFECRLRSEIARGPSSDLVLLDVLLVHAADGVWNDALDCADIGRWSPLARLGSIGGPNYGVIGRTFTLDKPALP